ncbi:uncharacterized protein LOC142140960 [Mixophyes fleayi]|uniref:uncharacterized protein LOC142140960 n=1 Tax=Mixophyes fleayi TaxID=3061075 RepID=UPI003F4D983C
MPHAEKNFSQHVYDSSIEPHFKKSKPDYSSWTRRDTAVHRETQPQKWSLPMVSEDRYYQSNKSECEGPRVTKDFKNYSVVESFANHCDGRDYNKVNQQPFAFAKTDKCKNNSDATFSETSTAFIGPLFKTPPPEKPAPENRNHPKVKSPSFKITTVELGKTANQSKGEDGIDYELRQFYKELNELKAETDDQINDINHTVVDIGPHFSPFNNKAPASLHANPHHSPVTATLHANPHHIPAPATLHANLHHSPAPASQPFTPFPSKPSTLLPFNCHPSEASTSQVRHPTLPHNQVSFHSQTSFNTVNTSFLNRTMPPPGFEGRPPPSFIVPFGPPPPRYNYPLTLPRQNNIPPPVYNPTDNYPTVNNNSHPWHSSHVPPERRTTSRGMSYTKPFPQGTGEKTQQEPPCEDHYGQKYRHFGEQPLHQGSNVSREQYPDRYRDSSSCRNSQRKLVLLRGLPGSGKSTLARTLLDQSPDGIIFSTDDYFCQETGYTYDVKLLGDAHCWNHNRAKRAMDDGRSPIIIDNTNIQGWEMKPYVQMAIDRGYDVEILEPDTWWKLDPHELEKRNTHRVPCEKIAQMLERYESNMTVSVIMNSVEPRHVRSNRPPPETRPRWGASVDCSQHSTSFHSR